MISRLDFELILKEILKLFYSETEYLECHRYTFLLSVMLRPRKQDPRMVGRIPPTACCLQATKFVEILAVITI
jgi:hypothetical protein